MSANFGDIGGGPARVNLHIAADGPAQKRLRLQESSNEGLKSGIVRGCGQEHADTPHALALLRMCGEWPSGYGAGKDTEKFTPPHVGSQGPGTGIVTALTSALLDRPDMAQSHRF